MIGKSMAPVACAMLMLGGCALMGGSPEPIRDYDLDTAIEVDPIDAPLGRQLGVRRFSAPTYVSYPMVYRSSDVRLETYPFDRWAELPAVLVTHAMTSAFRSSNAFSAVEPMGVLRRPGHVLDGELLRFEEVRDRGETVAVMAARLRIVDTSSDDVIWSATFEGRRPLDGSGPAALARAMGTALEDAARSAVAAFTDEASLALTQADDPRGKRDE